MKRSIESLSRRRFLRLAAATGGAIALGSRPSRSSGVTLPLPSRSGIKHIVVLMMENRSFDHFLGWMGSPANGMQSGLSYNDSNGIAHATHPLGLLATTPDYQGCGLNDPDHSYEGGRVEYDGGLCDGWRKNGANAADDFSIGYYSQGDLPFFGNAALDWTVCSNYFAGIMAETYPNRFHMHAAATDRIHNSLSPAGGATGSNSTLPTIWDRLAQHGYTGKYYYGDIPFLALWGSKYLGISQPVAQFITDAGNGALPNVSFIDPRFEDESSGTSGDDHPHADIRAGETFMNLIYNAVVTSPNFGSTVFIINFDEWGGFFDHVQPPIAPVPPATQAAADAEVIADGFVETADLGRLGFRVPNIVISPFARRGYISNEQFDHTSILKMISWRFGLPALTVRDQTANNIADVLNFSSPSLLANTYSVPTLLADVCTAPAPQPSTEEFAPLKVLAQQLGFVIP